MRKIIDFIIWPIVNDWDRVKIVVPIIALLIFIIWLSFWGMAKTVEIREGERLGGRYVGLEAISQVKESGE